MFTGNAFLSIRIERVCLFIIRFDSVRFGDTDVLVPGSYVILLLYQPTSATKTITNDSESRLTKPKQKFMELSKNAFANLRSFDLGKKLAL